MGAAPSKLVLGLPLYGRIFKLRSKEGTPGLRARSDGAGKPGEYVQEPGFWGYNEVSVCYMWWHFKKWNRMIISVCMEWYTCYTKWEKTAIGMQDCCFLSTMIIWMRLCHL
jgi:hypothetical protein